MSAAPALRAEEPADAAALHAVHASAFPTESEARLVDALRANGNAVVSLVAASASEIVGHVLFSPVTIEPGPLGARGLGLAPLAVRPAQQRRGIGAALVAAGLDACRKAGIAFVVVLGEPHYYRRFGFRRARSAGLDNEYGADEEFMLLELQPDALRGVHGTVRYGTEFAALDAPDDGR